MSQGPLKPYFKMAVFKILFVYIFDEIMLILYEMSSKADSPKLIILCFFCDQDVE